MNNPGIDLEIWKQLREKWARLDARGDRIKVDFNLLADPQDEKNILAIDVIQHINDREIVVETVQHIPGEAYGVLGIAELSIERLKEVLKSGGINVSPLEVEQLLTQHPDVKDAHVVGMPDKVLGEVIVAFVQADGPVSADALRAFVKERAASFKVPHHVLVRTEEQLPRLASGKIARHQLVQEAIRELGAA